MRRTGKTFRTYLRACLECSEGKNVLLVVYDKNSKDRMINYIRNASFFIEKLRVSSNKIEFPNGNYIVVLTAFEAIDNKARGCNFDYIDEDLDYRITRGDYFATMKELRSKAKK